MKNILSNILQNRILVMDGAMGTMIQSYNLSESDFRGDVLKDHPKSQKGNNDLLSLTQPEVITEIHYAYLEAGADIIGTNTFNASGVSQKDYGTSELAYDMNFQAAVLARKAADLYSAKTPDKPRFVAGDMGPTNQTCSISPKVDEPAFRNVTFDEIADAYAVQVRAFIDAKVDVLLVETVFDTLNCKAALYAIQTIQEERGTEIPVMVSGTITDLSGRLLSGQTVEAFWYSVHHVPLLSIGLNCAFGATALRPFIESLSNIADTFVSIHPNAGLPNEIGDYDESPEFTAGILEEFARSGFVNLVGGCCGTTPAHIKAITDAVQNIQPRKIPRCERFTRLAGLEPLDIRKESLFVNVGERTNVAGSSRFKKLILNGEFEKALDVARQQVENGAQIIDINMDEGLLESQTAMVTFLNYIAAEPDISRVPVMIDSSRWDVLAAGLRCVQGKPVVNSLSLKDGEQAFILRAKEVKKLGAALIVMAFDELGQADTLTRRLECCNRAYRILTENVGFCPEDIIFDPNIYAIGTGIDAHNNYAADYITAVKTLKVQYPYSLISGGVSNLSFSFRGNDAIREAIHSVFLFHAIQAGMDMGIVNAGQLAVYEEIPDHVREAVKDIIFNRRSDATDRLITLASSLQKRTSRQDSSPTDSWREHPVKERIIYSLVHGVDRYIDLDIEEIRLHYPAALDVIEGPLMDGMRKVGDLFGSGKMFLPQVVKSARVMKKAVTWLDPYLKAEKLGRSEHNGTIILATVKGDVHDIGKSIVSVVLQCNNYRIIDLGVMVPADRILDAAVSNQADIIGLSGLITPSLDEMVHVAKEMERTGLKIPLLIGGATTSRIHTAIKIDPVYSGATIYVTDASHAIPVLSQLMDSTASEEFIQSTKSDYATIREQRDGNQYKPRLLSLENARKNKYQVEESNALPTKPNQVGRFTIPEYPLEELVDYIDWSPFFHTWNIKGKYSDIINGESSEAAKSLYSDARKLLDTIVTHKQLTARVHYGIFPAARIGDDIQINDQDRPEQKSIIIHNIRQQLKKGISKPNFCLSDFIYPATSGIQDWLGAFVVTAGLGMDDLAHNFTLQNDDYNAIMVKSLADRLAEAMAERIHERIRKEFWGFNPDEHLSIEDLLQEKYPGIRPAPGYPANPDHSEKKLIFDLLDITDGCGIELTEHYAMHPAASVCGWIYAHPEAQYFNLGKINREQVQDYAHRKKLSVEEVSQLLQSYLSD